MYNIYRFDHAYKNNNVVVLYILRQVLLLTQMPELVISMTSEYLGNTILISCPDSEFSRVSFVRITNLHEVKIEFFLCLMINIFRKSK